jgi:hypothetical protein
VVAAVVEEAVVVVVAVGAVEEVEAVAVEEAVEEAVVVAVEAAAVGAVEEAAVVAATRPLLGRQLPEHPTVARRLTTCPQRASHTKRFRHRSGDRLATAGHAGLQR